MNSKTKLMDADELLEARFTAQSRPCKRTLWNWVALGLVPAVRVGKSVFFDPNAVEKALFSNKPKSAPREKN